MMKKVTVKQLTMLSLLMAMAWSVSAQMKVGDNPNTINKGSILELEAKDKGVLYPRVALTASNAWLPLQGTAVAGMTVYNTATVTATTSATTSLSPGFYFWEGAKWNKLATEGAVAEVGEWATRRLPSGEVITYLKKADAQNDSIMYYSNTPHVKRGYYSSIGKTAGEVEGHANGAVIHTEFVSTSALNNASSHPSDFFGGFVKSVTVTKEHFDRNTEAKKNYTGIYNGVFTENAITGTIDHINGNISSLLIGRTDTPGMPSTSVNVGYAVGGRFYTGSHSSGLVKAMLGGYFQADNGGGGSVTDLHAVDSRAINFAGDVTNLIALKGYSSARKGNVANMTGLQVRADFTNEANVGVASLIDLKYVETTAPASLKNSYGLKISDIKMGVNNYAIYTGKGNVHFNDDVHSTRGFYQGVSEGSSSKDVLYKDVWRQPALANTMQWLGTNGSYRASWAWNGFRDVNDQWRSLKVTKTDTNTEYTIGSVIEQGHEGISFKIQDMNGVTASEPSERMRITPEGKIGVGTATPKESLEVNGNVKAVSFIAANMKTFPDYVFETYYNGTSELNNDYGFMSLEEVEAFTKANNHLPGYESARAVAQKGSLDIVNTQIKNVEKIEELYLHTIAQEKKIKRLEALVEKLLDR